MRGSVCAGAAAVLSAWQLLLLAPGAIGEGYHRAENAASGLSGEAVRDLSVGSFVYEDDAESLQALQVQLARCNSMMGPLKEGAIALEVKAGQCEDALRGCQAAQESSHLDTNELEDLRTRNKLVEDGMSDKELSIYNLRRKKAALEQNVTQLTRLGQTYRMKNKSLRKEVEHALSLLEYEKSSHEETKALLEEWKAKASASDAKVEQLSSSVLASRLKAAEDEAKMLRSELEAARRVASTSKQGLAESESRVAELESELSETKIELESSTLSTESLREKVAEVESSNDLLEKQHKAAAQEVSSAKVELVQMRHKLEDLDTEKQTAAESLSVLDRKHRDAEKESERLKELFEQYKSKVDDPALVDYFMKKAEWLKHPHVEGVDQAYDKTVKLLGPKLKPTQVALLEMQTILQTSTDRLSVSVPTKYSPLVSGLFTYGMLLLPLGITSCLLVRLKRCISLSKATMLMALYNLVFCAMMFSAAKLVPVLEGKEPMFAFREHNEEAFEFLQIVIPAYYTVFVSCQILQAMRLMVRKRCKCSIESVILVVVPFVVMYRYYIFVWLRAMHDEEPKIPVDEWLFYSGAFLLIFALNVRAGSRAAKTSGLGGTRSHVLPMTSSDSSSQPLLSGDNGGSDGDSDSKKRKQRKLAHGHLVEKAREAKEEAENPHTVNVSAEIVDPEEYIMETAELVKEKVAESFGGKKKKSSSKNKKKAKRPKDSEDTRKED